MQLREKRATLVGMRLAPRHDTVFSLCLSAAIAILCLGLATSCSHPLPDLGKVKRAQFSRTLHEGDATCQQWLPLVVRSDVGQSYVALALEAAQPWTDSLGLAIAVPAVGDEPATVVIRILPCPADMVQAAFPYCQRIAQAAGACDGDTYRVSLEVFFVGSVSTLVQTLTHELGHALGVKEDADASGHSANARSIMFKSIDVTPASTASPQVVTPEDAASVRAAWGVH